MGLLPLIQRNKIPLVETFEWIGKRSYGFYLTHLVAINLAIMLMMAVAPAVLGAQAVAQPLLFAVGMGGPALLLTGAAKLPIRAAYRYVFG
jgi:peptidoglycan/LPS O-acetylase OafA/YrhL